MICLLGGIYVADTLVIASVFSDVRQFSIGFLTMRKAILFPVGCLCLVCELTGTKSVEPWSEAGNCLFFDENLD
jgi:hypothetical protein